MRLPHVCFDCLLVPTITVFMSTVLSSSSSSSSANFIATQVLRQNFRTAMCHVLHYSCNVNAAVADSLHCRMICGTVPFSVNAWMPPATAATWRLLLHQELQTCWSGGSCCKPISPAVTLTQTLSLISYCH